MATDLDKTFQSAPPFRTGAQKPLRTLAKSEKLWIRNKLRMSGRSPHSTTTSNPVSRATRRAKDSSRRGG